MSRDGRNASVQFSIEKILKTLQKLKWSNQLTELDTECSEITEEEIRQYIRKLKRNKPTGSDNIKVEVIKESEDISANLLHTLFNKIWGKKVSEQQKNSPSK